MAVSLTAGIAGTAGIPVPTDVDLSLGRARQFFRTEQLMSAVAVLSALWFRVRYVDVATGYIVLAALAVPVVVTEWCLRRLRSDNLVSSVLVMLALFWISTLILAPLAPFALPLMPFAVLVPLLAAGPIFDGRQLRALIAAGTVVMAAIAALAVLPGYDGIDRQIPAGLQHSVVITGLALRIVTASFAVLDTNRRRSASLAALADANQALRESRRRLVMVADEERRRIERDLHDGAQQHLVAVALRLRLLATAHPEVTEDVTTLAADLGEAIDGLRELAHGIYPPLLERRGLADAVAAAARRSALDAEVIAHGLGRYPPAIESAVYFCCLEALQNSAKHAGGAARVQVTIAATDDGLSFEVRDDGPGFVDATAARAGHGLRNMADRLAAVGAELRFDTPPQGGLAVRAVVPHAPGACARRWRPGGAGTTRATGDGMVDRPPSIRHVAMMTGVPTLPPAPVAARAAPRIFVVDDSPTFRGAIEAVIRAAGCEPVGWAGAAQDAWQQLQAIRRTAPPDLVLVDVQLPDASGTDLALVLAERLGLRVALVSTLAEADLPATPAACGAIAFVSKSALDPPTLSALARPQRR